MDASLLQFGKWQMNCDIDREQLDNNPRFSHCEGMEFAAKVH
jgi:hypothetical protein